MKKNILICNNRYFISGGPEKYMFSVTSLLESKGYKVFPFAINYSRNVKTEYSKYFATPPVDEKNIYYSDMPLSTKDKASLFCKTVYNFDAGRKIQSVLKKKNINLVYTLQIVNLLYSSVINESKKMGVPVIARLSDFQLLCPAYTFFRNGKVCEDCKNGYYYALKNKCLQDSYGVTLGRVLAMYVYKLLGIQEKIDAIIAPSKFLQDKLVDYGIDKSKITTIPSFINADNYEPSYDFENYILYVGNIQKYKGLEVLIKSFKNVTGHIKLKIVGSSNDGEDDRIKKYVKEKGMKNIEFLGFKSGHELKALYQNSMFVVVPSVWYENMPNVILESMAYGKPVIGSNLGSIPELIMDNENGLLFEPLDDEDLTQKIMYMVENKKLISIMGKNARNSVEKKYNSNLHYNRLTEVFKKVMTKEGIC